MSGASLYTILSLDQKCTLEQIKQSYRKLSLIHHPDKGGNIEIYQKITGAYSILSDPDKRRVYDFELNTKNNIINPLQDIFNTIFPSGINFNDPSCNQQQIVIEPIHVTIDITLKQLYNKEELKVPVTKRVTCVKCNLSICSKCNGSGILRIQTGLLALNTKCLTCNGYKYILECKTCNNSGLITDSTYINVKCWPDNIENTDTTTGGNPLIPLTITVQDGHQLSRKLLFSQVSKRGNVIIRLNEISSDFIRKGFDIYYTATISLTDALCGFKLYIKFINDSIKINSPEGSVITPETVNELPNKGLVMLNKKRGSLFIKYKIIFPDNDFTDKYSELKKILKL